MAYLTQNAIKGYRDYTKDILQKARYKIGSTYYDAAIKNVNIEDDATLSVVFMVEPPIVGTSTITEVQLIDIKNEVWLTKKESLTNESPQEGFYYYFEIVIREGEG